MMTRVKLIHKGMDSDRLDNLSVSDYIATMLTFSAEERRQRESMVNAISEGISLAFKK